jgi:hypothetical protein
MQRTKLVEKYLPGYTFNEYHGIVVNCPIENVYEITKDFGPKRFVVSKY